MPKQQRDRGSEGNITPFIFIQKLTSRILQINRNLGVTS